MVPIHSTRLAALLEALVLITGLVSPTRAADDTALKIIPADAAFFSSSLRIKEQIDIVAKSNAWATVWKMPAVQQGWKMLVDEYKADGKLAPVHNFFAQEENKELLTLLADAGSHEIFVYGGQDWVTFIDLLQRAYGAASIEPLQELIDGNPAGLSQNELQARAVLKFLSKNPQLLKLPDFVVGCKITDAKRAEKQLKRLEAVLEMFAGIIPQLQGRVKKEKINDSNFLTLTLDGSLVPWDMIPIKDIEDKPGEFAPVIAQLKKLTLTISVGVQKDYLLFSIGGNTAQLAKIGGAGAKLATRVEMKPLAKFADKKLVSVGYASKAFLAQAGAGMDYEGYVTLAKNALPKSPLPDEQQKRIIKDLTDLSKELKTDKTAFGASVNLSFMTPRGIESLNYNYSKNPQIDGSKPLTLLNHLGGDPLLAAVGRAKVDGSGYKMLVKWVKVVYGHVDEIVLANIPGDEKDEYQKVTASLLPLFKRFDDNTLKQFIPALADGQLGFVLDAKWSSKHWLSLAPATPNAMPMPELGVVLGVTDAAKLRKSMAEYLTLTNDMIGAVRALQAAAGTIPNFSIPAPESVKKQAGTLYFYKLPEAIGLDAQVVPTAGLSDKTAVLTLSHSHAERLLTSTPLKLDGGPLAAHLKNPLASAFYCNWPAIVDAATPWIEMGVSAAIGDGFIADGPNKKRDEIMAQVKTVLEVLKVYRGTTSATFFEDGVIVTHSESVFKDLGK